MSLLMKVDDVANEIGLSSSTIKKYYLMIEEHGYRFKRSQQGQVLFTEADINLFQRIIKLKNEPGMSVKKAVEYIVSTITDITVYEDKEDVPEKSDNAELLKELQSIKEFMEKQNKYIDRQEEINAELMKEIKATQKYVATSFEERDETLKLTLKEAREVKSIIDKKPEKKWWQIF